MTLRERPVRLRAARSARPRPEPMRAVCVVCGHEDTAADARLEGRQVSRDGSQVHCRVCAEGLAIVLDDAILFWPACGHAGDDGEALYDRAVCIVCETD